MDSIVNWFGCQGVTPQQLRDSWGWHTLFAIGPLLITSTPLDPGYRIWAFCAVGLVFLLNFAVQYVTSISIDAMPVDVTLSLLHREIMEKSTDSLRGQTVHWRGALFCVCMFLDFRDFKHVFKHSKILSKWSKKMKKQKKNKIARPRCGIRIQIHKMHSLTSLCWEMVTFLGWHSAWTDDRDIQIEKITIPSNPIRQS